jgi:hypothetical protein
VVVEVAGAETRAGGLGTLSVRAVHEALAVVVADIAFLACAEEADGAVAAAATMVTSLEQACGCDFGQV